jgi:hypothetical protein
MNFRAEREKFPLMLFFLSTLSLEFPAVKGFLRRYWAIFAGTRRPVREAC